MQGPGKRLDILVETRVGKNMSTTFVVHNICSSFSELDSYLSSIAMT